MFTTVEIRKLPFVKQNGDFCIPASIENVMKYHGVNIDQYQIACLWRENQPMHSIALKDMAPILKNSHSNGLEFISGASDNADIIFRRNQEVIEYAESCVNENNPLIVTKGVMREGQQVGAHMLIVVGYNNDSILVFNTQNAHVGKIHKDMFRGTIGKGRQTLLIKPKPEPKKQSK